MASRIALVLGVMLGAVWIASARWGFVYWGRPGAWSGIGWGNAYFCCERTRDPESWESGWELFDHSSFRWSLSFDWTDSSLYYVNVPLWIPVLVLFLLAVLAWWKHDRPRRWLARGLCAECGYNRAGLGKERPCPECGAPSPDAD